MTREELTKILEDNNVVILHNGEDFMSEIIKLHEEKVKQLAIYLNK